MAKTMVEMNAVDEIGQNNFESRYHPETLANGQPIAYGGGLLAVAVNAACATVKPHYRLYSAMGYFLSPARIDRKLKCSVQELRNTRTFATRNVTVTQQLDNETIRTILFTTMDFQVPEKDSILVYSASPTVRIPQVDTVPTMEEAGERLVREGKVSRAQLETYKATFALNTRLFDIRDCPESVLPHNLNGSGPEANTTQDHLSLTEKSSSHWIRSRSALSTYTENITTLAFSSDAAMAFIPQVHDHRALYDNAACGSLDFALRIFSNDLDMNQWHVKEWKTIAGGSGRTYTEARMWNSNGVLVSSMTEQSILRPQPSRAKI